MIKEGNTKTNHILEYMRENPWITNEQAVEEFGAYRLGSLIHSLRKQGYSIDTVIVDTTDRYGHKVKYARYILNE